MDQIGWFIATLHSTLGHDKAAAWLGQDPGDRRLCIICLYDRGEATKQDVIDQLSKKEGN